MDERFDDLSTVIAEITSLLEGDQTLHTTLERIAEITCDAIAPCHACGVVVAGEQGSATSGWANGQTSGMEELARTAAQTIGAEAVRRGDAVVIGSPSEANRWPAFHEAATQAGIDSALVLPVPGIERARAMMFFFSHDPDAFGETERSLAELFSTHVGVAIRNAGVYSDCLVLVGQLEEAMATRAVIEQAKGVLMEREAVTADRAFDLLKEASQRTNQKLRQVAAALVARVGERGPP